MLCQRFLQRTALPEIAEHTLAGSGLLRRASGQNFHSEQAGGQPV